MRNLKQIFCEAYVTHRNIKVPQDIINWIEKNANEIIKRIKIKYKEKIPTPAFTLQHSPQQRRIHLEIITDKDYNDTAHYEAHTDTIYLNGNMTWTEEKLKTILVHEFTHAIDKLNDKNLNTRVNRMSHLGKPHSLMAPAEVEAYLTTIEYQLPLLIKQNPLLKKEISNYLKGQDFPWLPNEFKNITNFVNKFNSNNIKRIKQFITKDNPDYGSMDKDTLEYIKRTEKRIKATIRTIMSSSS